MDDDESACIHRDDRADGERAARLIASVAGGAARSSRRSSAHPSRRSCSSLALAAPKLARAHEDSEEEGHASPTGTAVDKRTMTGLRPRRPRSPRTTWEASTTRITRRPGTSRSRCAPCVVKPGAYLAITPGATIKFRPNCTYEDAKLWA